MAINKITDEQLHKIRKKSAKALPDRPTREGYSAEQIKSHLADFVLGDIDSFKAEVDRIVDETNAELENTNKRFDEKVGNNEFENKVNEIYTEMGNVSMGDGSTFNFARKLYEESKNLFNGDLQQGAYIYANGDYTYSTSYVCNAKPIPVQAGKQIKLSYISIGNVFATGFVFYRSGNYIGSASGDLATVPSNANQVCFNIESTDKSPVSNYSNVQLEYGDVETPYQPYNSTSHITNAQADLLELENNKQLNKLSYPYGDTTKATSGMEFIDNDDGRLRVRGTSISNAVFYLKRGEFKLPKGIYTMSSNYYGEGIYIESNTGYFTFLELNKSKTTFVLTEDKTFNNLYMVVKQGYTIDITLELMLNEGTEAFPYQEWTGGNVTKKDIASVSLWKNATPNNDMGAMPLPMTKPLSNFKSYTAYYKVSKDSIDVLSMRVPVGYGTRLSAFNTLEGYVGMFHRHITYTNETTLNISNGYFADLREGTPSEDTGCIIILKIEGNYY